jgi:hypothetical protein
VTSWESKKQATLTISLVEVEYVAAKTIACQEVWYIAIVAHRNKLVGTMAAYL